MLLLMMVSLVRLKMLASFCDNVECFCFIFWSGMSFFECHLDELSEIIFMESY